MMPAFKPLAGSSPNCSAVRVQTEHWASAETYRRLKPMSNINMMNSFFIDNESKIKEQLVLNL